MEFLAQYSTYLILGIILYTILQGMHSIQILKNTVGPKVFKECKDLIKWLNRIAIRIRIVIGISYAVFGTGIYFFIAGLNTGTYQDLWWPALLILLGILQIIRTAIIPTIILLGASRTEQLVLNSYLVDKIATHETMSLLESGHLLLDMKNAGRCYRVPYGDDIWKIVITKCVEKMPLIVVDTRVITDAVRDEIKMIIDQNAFFKTLILGVYNSSSEASQVLGIPHKFRNEIVHINDEETLINVINHVLTGYRRTPSRKKPISKLAEGLLVS